MRDREFITPEDLQERYELIMEGIERILQEQRLPSAYGEYFSRMAQWCREADKAFRLCKNGDLEQWEPERCRELQRTLYHGILPENYEQSFYNPAYAVKRLGAELGGVLSAVASDMLVIVPAAYEGRQDKMLIWLELFGELYGIFTAELSGCGEDENDAEFEPESLERIHKSVRNAYYWFYHDYLDVFVPESVLGMIDASDNFFRKIVMEEDLFGEAYLYRYGAYIGENERRMQAFLAGLSQEDIDLMARTFAQGYRMGFQATGKDISAKRTVKVEYPIGFERIVRAAVLCFEDMGLSVSMSREAVTSFEGRGGNKRGCYASSPNQQFDYDHKDDRAFYLDKAFVERRLEVLRDTYEKNRELAATYGGPAVMEVFGGKPFAPVNQPEKTTFSERQDELNVSYAARAGAIVNEFIPGDAYSYTIIAFPIPEIGKDFPAIFRKTMEINTLDSLRYRDMQQRLIDVLDQGGRVHITGRGKNYTDLWVALHPLQDPDTQTNFENCVADVNIPVGEVFTSPVLKGTNGVLHVTQVYLGQLCYRNLELTFQDGMVTSYSCSNFESEEENRRYIRDNLLYHHPTLPMGEFAIGTNTAAYRMAREYDIADRLPILIAEKTGPHFAVGDTCYSHSEDVPMYNPNGKEVIARENEVSALRREDAAKAYFNCHTDITIPYDELGDVVVQCGDGKEFFVLKEGKFAVPGTEELNREL